MMNEKTAIFFGAHPDDIEIGAWTLAHKLSKNGWKLWFFIMTNDVSNPLRIEEARVSASTLSNEIEVYFLNEPDGKLNCNSDTVRKVRSMLSDCSIVPDVVVCHSGADSHNDHRATNEIVRATFRESIIVEYPVINSLVDSEFKFNLLTKVTEDVFNSQKKALVSHVSQVNRISIDKIQQFRKFHHNGEVENFDKFKIVLQAGFKKDILSKFLSVTDDFPVNKLLGKIIRNGLVVINGENVFRKNRTVDDAIISYGKSGSNLIRAYAQNILGHEEIIEIPSSDYNTHKFAEESSILISGGSVSNSFSREYYEHFKGIHYLIDYSMPNYAGQCILELSKSKNNRIFSKYGKDDFGTTFVIEDIGILTFMRNPLNEKKWLIGCMGIHSLGTTGCFKSMLNQKTALQILEYLEKAIASSKLGIQVLIKHSAGLEPTFLKNSWRFIENN